MVVKIHLQHIPLREQPIPDLVVVGVQNLRIKQQVPEVQVLYVSGI
jgi:hypothetical protein